MTIKGKLLSMISVFMILFCGVIAMYFLIMAPISKIEDEKEILRSLKDSIQTEQILFNKIIGTYPFVRQMEYFIEQEKKTAQIFKEMETVEYLRSSSSDISESLDIILELKKMKQSRFDEMIDADLAFSQSVKDIYFIMGSFSFSKIYSERKFQKNPEDPQLVHFYTILESYLSTFSIYDESLKSTLLILGEQFSIIEKKIGQIERKSLVFILCGISIIIALVFSGALFFTNSIVKNIKTIEGSISLLKDGDLCTAGVVKSRDDLGRLNDNLGKFQNVMKKILNRIKGISSENLSIRDTLSSHVGDTAETSRKIGFSADDIKNDIENLDETVEASFNSVDVLSGNLDRLNDSIMEQTSMIEESSAAVNQMMASINSVEQVTVKKLGNLKDMISSMEDGNLQLRDTSGSIEKINESIDSISSMINVINKISSQTNLLAMNAAIEAAHAGDSGRGFAVVADEIRKLAELSAVNSKEISTSLKDIIGRITRASDTSGKTMATFSQTLKALDSLFNSFSEIGQSMVELKIGGDQIISAMNSLQTMAVEVRTDSIQMTDQSHNMSVSIENVRSISGRVSTGIGGISLGVQTINNAIEQIRDMTDSIGSVAERIDTELVFFKT